MTGISIFLVSLILAEPNTSPLMDPPRVQRRYNLHPFTHKNKSGIEATIAFYVVSVHTLHCPKGRHIDKCYTLTLSQYTLTGPV